MCLSVKSTSTTMTRTVPCNGARSAAAERMTPRDVPSGNASGGMMTPSFKPIALGSDACSANAFGTAPDSRTAFRAAFSLSRASGDGATAQRAPSSLIRAAVKIFA